MNKIKRIPLPLMLLGIATFILIIQESNFNQFIYHVNEGFGKNLGYFLMIICPSFILAESLSKLKINKVLKNGYILAPIFGAAMQCPDTSYLTLNSIMKNNQILNGFTAYLGFKLLFPAAPLLLSSIIGFYDVKLIIISFSLFIPLWLVQLVAYKLFIKNYEHQGINSTLEEQDDKNSIFLYLPFLIILILPLIGIVFKAFSHTPSYLIILFEPVGALAIGATIAFLSVQSESRKEVLPNALRKCFYLISVIGIASLLAYALNLQFNLTNLVNALSAKNYISLFIIAITLKIIQGSSMSSIAIMGSLLSTLSFNSTDEIVLAIMTIALGSMVSILPNDSFYWILKNSAFKNISHIKTNIILFFNSLFLAVLGMVILNVII